MPVVLLSLFTLRAMDWGHRFLPKISNRRREWRPIHISNGAHQALQYPVVGFLGFAHPGKPENAPKIFL